MTEAVLREVRASELASEIGVTQARISQLVAEGKLDGCFRGEGRDRRFDLIKAVEVLGRKLHPGQVLGNGAAAAAARDAVLRGMVPAAAEDAGPADATERAYRVARTEAMQADARRKRLQNAEDEGRYVLAEAAEREAQRQVATEIAMFEGMLRDAARRLADRLAVDFREARAVLTECWREHRTRRAAELAAAPEGVLSPDEIAADI